MNKSTAREIKEMANNARHEVEQAMRELSERSNESIMKWRKLGRWDRFFVTEHGFRKNWCKPAQEKLLQAQAISDAYRLLEALVMRLSS